MVQREGSEGRFGHRGEHRDEGARRPERGRYGPRDERGMSERGEGYATVGGGYLGEGYTRGRDEGYGRGREGQGRSYDRGEDPHDRGRGGYDRGEGGYGGRDEGYGAMGGGYGGYEAVLRAREGGFGEDEGRRFGDERRFSERRFGERRFEPRGESGERRFDTERTEGPFRGVGPRGYRRSDERMREEVCDRLTDHPRVDASHIEVTCSDGEVTLSGTVSERAMKRLAEDCAESISGVRDVNNRLRVRDERDERERDERKRDERERERGGKQRTQH